MPYAEADAPAARHAPATEVHGSRRALVIADDIGVFLAVARSLGRAGVATDVATSEHHYPGLASRYVNRVHAAPAYVSHTAEWIEALEGLIRSHDYGLVVPTNDASLRLLAEHADRLGRDRLAIPNRAALDAFADKAATRTIAEAANVPMAEGMSVTADTTPAELERSLGLPLIVKPRSSYRPGRAHAKVAAALATSSEELAQVLAEMRDYDLIAESYFAGEGVGISVLARDGEVRLAWQHRRLAEVGTTGRSSARVGEDIDPALYRDVTALVAATRLSGVAMFEFRQDRDRGTHVLIEVNPRFWGSLPLALAGGADFPAALWRQMTGSAADTGEPQTNAAAKRSLQGEWDRLSSRPAGQSRWAVAPRLLRLLVEAAFRPTAFDGWATDDRRPHGLELRQIVKRHLRSLVGAG